MKTKISTKTKRKVKHSRVANRSTSNISSNSVSSDESTDDDIKVDSIGDYDSMLRDEMREYCRAKGLQVGGYKKTLQTRLTKFDNDPSSVRKVAKKLKYVDDKPPNKVNENNDRFWISSVCCTPVCLLCI